MLKFNEINIRLFVSTCYIHSENISSPPKPTERLQKVCPSIILFKWFLRSSNTFLQVLHFSIISQKR